MMDRKLEEMEKDFEEMEIELDEDFYETAEIMPETRLSLKKLGSESIGPTGPSIGQSINPLTSQPGGEREDARLEGYLESDIKVCLQKNQEYYLDKFQSLPDRRVNGAALVFSTNWMAYRLMWREAFLFYLVEVAYLLVFTPFCLKFSVAIGLGKTAMTWFFIVAGCAPTALIRSFFGDTFYWRKIKRELDRHGRKNSEVPMTEAEVSELKERTGTSKGSVAAAIVLTMVANRLLIYVAVFEIVLLIKWIV